MIKTIAKEECFYCAGRIVYAPVAGRWFHWDTGLFGCDSTSNRKAQPIVPGGMFDQRHSYGVRFGRTTEVNDEVLR